MLRCSIKNMTGYSNFKKPVIFSIEGGNIVKKEIDIRILVIVREIFIVRKRDEAHIIQNLVQQPF